ncbi:occludin-like, partial [Polypterus senegalus]|uniref:occludin-like n=1 Tax=Polypterus senegalus TaxID=55291 RepID=UPI0019657398
VNNVDPSTRAETATLVYSEKPTSPVDLLKSATSYPTNPSSYFSSDTYTDNVDPTSTPKDPPPEYPGETITSSPSDQEGVRRPAAKRGKRRRKNPELDESQYETDYTTGMDTGDELNQEDWYSLYPPLRSDVKRQEYKREFDSDLKEYKKMCAEMDDINDQINQLSKQLDLLQDGTIQYQGVAEEYNRLKDLKRVSSL